MRDRHSGQKERVLPAAFDGLGEPRLQMAQSRTLVNSVARQHDRQRCAPCARADDRDSLTSFFSSLGPEAVFGAGQQPADVGLVAIDDQQRDAGEHDEHSGRGVRRLQQIKAQREKRGGHHRTQRNIARDGNHRDENAEHDQHRPGSQRQKNSQPVATPCLR